MLELDCDGHHALAAEPYAQACTRAGDGLYVVATGGGGGAAQLMPATLLGEAIDAARAEASGEGHARLLRWFVGVDARMAALRTGEIYRGSGAHAVAAVHAGELLWLGAAGLARGYRIERDRCVVVTRDDSLLADVVDASVDLSAGFPHGGVVTAVLGCWREHRAGWRPLATPLADAEGFVLATAAAYVAGGDGVLERLARVALGSRSLVGTARAMWEGLRSTAVNVAAFERSAAVMILRPRVDPHRG